MTSYRFSELRAHGHSKKDIEAKVRAGEWIKLRHDGYLLPQANAELTPEDRHLDLLSVTRPKLRSGAIVSHVSAAVHWGLPVPRALLGKVHATVSRSSGAYRSQQVHVHTAKLTDAEVVQRDGLLMTCLARTAIDLACMCKPHEALAIMDAALRLSDADQLTKQSLVTRRQRGIGTMRWALANASQLADSPGESLCRYWMITEGLPPPVLQYEVVDADGRPLGRADFGWPDHGTLGEFDGAVKYGRLLKPGQSVTDAVMREKHRENKFRLMCWWVLRWCWSDLADGRAFARELLDFLLAQRTRTIVA